MADETVPVRLRAFIGRSFHQTDQPLWFEIRGILESLRNIGFSFEDAQEAQPRSISAKVREGIGRNDIYIGILTRRMPIARLSLEAGLLARLQDALLNPTEQTRWTASEWIVEETGFALGLGKKVILLVEGGVAFPPTDLDADTEWIPFDRAAVQASIVPLVQMITRLISERLPASPAPQPATPPVQEETSAAEAREPRSETDRLQEAMRLLDEKRFDEADGLVEESLREHPPDFQHWFRLFYLSRKYLKGDTPSLEKLREISRASPSDAEATEALAACYRGYKRYDQAATILLNGAEAAGADAKTGLLRQAALDLAAYGQHDRATDIIVQLLRKAPEGSEHFESLVSLADVGKRKGDQELESAALERALEINPGEAELRFRLAYLYSEMKRNDLAAYHYGLHAKHTKDSTALNNLGVAFGVLKLPGKEIEMYEAASTQNPLAKANLSHAFVDRGFLRLAEELAREADRIAADRIDRERAARALARIAQLRTEEEDREKTILTHAESERAFRSAYASAYVAPPAPLVKGVFNTPYGELTLAQDGTAITGHGEYQLDVPSGFVRLFEAPARGGPPKPRTITRSVRLRGNLVGRAGSFKVETREEERGGLLSFPKVSSAEGLLVVSAEADSIEILEHKDETVRIHRAEKLADS